MAIKDFVKKLFGRKNPVKQTAHDALIMKRMREHYEEALLHFPEDQIVGIFLQGSQNYGLDYEGSDVDTKLIWFQSLRISA